MAGPAVLRSHCGLRIPQVGISFPLFKSPCKTPVRVIAMARMNGG